MKRGPKPTLTASQRLNVGAKCDAAWAKLTDTRTMNPPHMSKIREVQAANRRVRWKYEVQRGSEKIDKLLGPRAVRDDGSIARGVSLKIVRPYGRVNEALMQGVAMSWRRYRKRITLDYARDCWDMFRREKKHIESIQLLEIK
jgi:hypothetical protein